MDNSWICKNDYKYSDKFFCKIFDFYVIKTPVKGVSYRGITFKKRKFRDAKQVLDSMKKMFPNLFMNFIHVDKDCEINSLFEKNNISNHQNNVIEYAIFKKYGSYGVTDSFFYYIRCAIAHGAFCIHEIDNDKYYYLENIHSSNRRKCLNARMVIKEQTLLEIIDLCNSKI